MNSRHLMRLVMAFFTATALSSPIYFYTNSASAQDAYVRQVTDRLYEAARLFVGYGEFNLSHEPEIDKLNRNQVKSYNLTLEEGRTYAIVAVCDNDCYDIDLHLFDSAGNLIDYDERLDADAVVTVVPGYRDRFTVFVDIPDCRASRCTYGVGFFVY